MTEEKKTWEKPEIISSDVDSTFGKAIPDSTEGPSNGIS